MNKGLYILVSCQWVMLLLILWAIRDVNKELIKTNKQLWINYIATLNGSIKRRRMMVDKEKLNEYENLEIKRDRPDYPRGMKHYSKETELENAIFDLDLALYRVKCLIRGTHNEKENLPNGTEDEEEAEEVLRRLREQGIYSDGSTTSDTEKS